MTNQKCFINLCLNYMTSQDIVKNKYISLMLLRIYCLFDNSSVDLSFYQFNHLLNYLQTCWNKILISYFGKSFLHSFEKSMEYVVSVRSSWRRINFSTDLNVKCHSLKLNLLVQKEKFKFRLSNR